MAKLNIDTFTQSIESDLLWRKKEISDLLFHHNQENNLLILKSTILLIYSHWEGYIKNASKQYLLFISDQNISLSQLNTNFEAIIIKADIRNCLQSSETLNLVNEIKFLKNIYDDQGKKFILPSSFKKEKDKTVINTKDNLNISTFKSFINIIGLNEFSPLETRISYIDEKLLSNRNIIAHGSKIDPSSNSFDLDIEELKKLRNLILLIMDFFKDELIYYAENKLYLYRNNESANIRAKITNETLEKEIKKIYPYNE